MSAMQMAFCLSGLLILLCGIAVSAMQKLPCAPLQRKLDGWLSVATNAMGSSGGGTGPNRNANPVTV